MQSHHETTPNPVVHNPNQEVASKKKILLFTQDFEDGRKLLAEIKKNHPLVVETVEEFADLIDEIARTTPHLVVLRAPMDSDEGAWMPQFVHHYFPNLPVCRIDGNLSENRWQAGLEELLARPIRPEVPCPYGEEYPETLHDKSLGAFVDYRPEPQFQENVFSEQKTRFLLQLQTARKHHSAAKHYFQCLKEQQAGLDQEIGYGLVHGSYQALSRSRELACKWLALLAHYVPDVELEYLPKAGSPSCHIDFVHHELPADGFYAAALILLREVKPTVYKAIGELLAVAFDDQSNDELLAISVKLYGIAKMLEQVGTAQIELMDAWLDPTVVIRAVDKTIPRREHRNLGIYRDFYDLGFIFQSPERLAAMLKQFHAGTSCIEQERYLPSFAEFRRLWRNAGEPADQPPRE